MTTIDFDAVIAQAGSVEERRKTSQRFLPVGYRNLTTCWRSLSNFIPMSGSLWQKGMTCSSQRVSRAFLNNFGQQVSR